jgi:hypothetical protein
LQKAECNKIFTDTASGAQIERKGLEEALTYVRKGDTLVVWRLDRLGRSLPHLIASMTDLEERGIGFKSLTENIDTTASGGNLFSTSSEPLRNLSEISSGNEHRQGFLLQEPEDEEVAGLKPSPVNN